MSTQLIAKLSAFTASSTPAQAVIERTAHLIRTILGAVRVSITLRAGRTVVSAESVATAQDPHPGLLFSRPIRVRGNDYGILQADFDRPTVSPQQLMQTLETAGWLIGGLARRLSLEVERNQLEAGVQDLQAELNQRKTLARATGIVAELRGLTIADAQRWIEDEAVKTRRSAAELADRIVLHRQVLRRSA